jgi:hypothetical protein
MKIVTEIIDSIKNNHTKESYPIPVKITVTHGRVMQKKIMHAFLLVQFCYNSIIN